MSNVSSWLPGLLGPVNLTDAQKAGQAYVIRWNPVLGQYVAELPIEAPAGNANELIGIDGLGGIKNVMPAGIAVGDLIYWTGTTWARVGPPTGSLDNATTYTLQRPAGAGGIPQWVSSLVTLDPDTLAWDGAWKPAYTASPWVGTETPTPSTGTTSGGRNAVTAGTAPTTVTIGGYTGASFNGSNKAFSLASGLVSDYVDKVTGICAGFVVFSTTAAAVDDATNFYLNPPVLGEGAGVWNISVSNAGFGFSFSRSGGATRAIKAVTTGAPKIGLFRYDGTNIEVSTDGGTTWDSQPATWSYASTTLDFRNPYIGRGNSSYYNGAIAEVYIRKAILTRLQLQQIAAHRIAKYGIT